MPSVSASITFASATLVASDTATSAVAATTLVSDVLIAAVTSTIVPVIFTAFETVTAAEDLPPRVLRTVAAILVPASSLTVTVSALLSFASVKVE